MVCISSQVKYLSQGSRTESEDNDKLLFKWHSCSRSWPFGEGAGTGWTAAWNYLGLSLCGTTSSWAGRMAIRALIFWVWHIQLWGSDVRMVTTNSQTASKSRMKNSEALIILGTELRIDGTLCFGIQKSGVSHCLTKLKGGEDHYWLKHYRFLALLPYFHRFSWIDVSSFIWP